MVGVGRGGGVDSSFRIFCVRSYAYYLKRGAKNAVPNALSWQVDLKTYLLVHAVDCLNVCLVVFSRELIRDASVIT